MRSLSRGSLTVFLALAFALTLSAAPPVTALAYRDANTLAAGTHGRVDIIDVKSGESTHTLQNLPGRITALAYSKTGQLAIASSEPAKSARIRIYAQPSAAPLADFVAHRDTIFTLAFAPDGRSLASGSYDRLIKVWDIVNLAAAPTPKLTLTDHSDAVYSVAFHPNGKLLASGAADRAVKIWDTSDGKRLYTLSDPTDWVYTVAWSPDGSAIAAAGADKSIRIWSANATTGKLTASVFAHSGAVTRLHFSSDGRTLTSVGEDQVVKVWNRATMTETSVFPKQPETILATALRPDNAQLALGLYNGDGLFVSASDGKVGAKFLPAKPKPPSASKLSLDAITRGRTAKLTITGERLDQVTGISATGVTAKILKQTPTQLDAELAATAAAPIDRLQLTLASAAGPVMTPAIIVDRYMPMTEGAATDSARTAMLVKLPTTIVGTIDRAGDSDYFAFDAVAGQQIGVQLVSPNGKVDPHLSISDAMGRVVLESSRSSLGFVAPTAGRYAIAVRDKDFRGAADMKYRLHVGDVPVVTSVFPLGGQRGKSLDVHIDGVNLGAPTGRLVKLTIPADAALGSRIAMPLPMSGETPLGDVSIVVGEFPSVVVADSTAELRSVPATADGILGKPGDSQSVRFPAKKGVPLLVEVQGKRLGSPLDSQLEILDSTGQLVPRATLRCVAKTYVTFRDHNSEQGGIRLETWNELGMRDYLYSNGELMRIAALPKGPDDDCQFVQVGGIRKGFLGTTPTHQAFGNVLYKVELHPAGRTFPPNGMPVFTIPYRNDDGGAGFGKDSMLLFDAPADGVYQARITDSRGAGGATYAYRLTVREPRPDFTISTSSNSPGVWKGGGVPITVNANRVDGYLGPIAVKLLDLPSGWTAPATTIEAEQESTTLTLYAEPNAVPISKPLTFEASATIGGRSIVRTASLGTPKTVEPGDLVTTVAVESLQIRPGEQTTIRVKVERRNGFKGRVPLDVRGLPYGVRVLNIGLNGILLTERDSERDVVIYAEPWVEPQTRPFTILSRRESTGREYAAKSVTLSVGK